MPYRWKELELFQFYFLKFEVRRANIERRGLKHHLSHSSTVVRLFNRAQLRYRSSVYEQHVQLQRGLCMVWAQSDLI